MQFAPGHRRSRLPRHALAWLLAIGLLLQPVLTALGEMHESVAHPESALLHADGHGTHAAADDGALHGEGVDDALHLLLHFAHCCGVGTGMVVAKLAGPLFVHAGGMLPSAAPPGIPSMRLDGVFRPPIRT